MTRVIKYSTIVLITQRKVSALYESLEHGFRESEGYVYSVLLTILLIDIFFVIGQHQNLMPQSKRKLSRRFVHCLTPNTPRKKSKVSLNYCCVIIVYVFTVSGHM